MKINAAAIHPKDTIVVVTEEIPVGGEVVYKVGDEFKTIKALDVIPIFHKVSSVAVKKGEFVLKYGENIGLALEDIAVGQHVHTHNLTNTIRS